MAEERNKNGNDGVVQETGWEWPLQGLLIKELLEITSDVIGGSYC